MEWISVKDRLPDYDTLVLWYDTSGQTFISEIDHDCDWHTFQSFNSRHIDGESWLSTEVIEITHWMPLPNPPGQQ